GFDRQLLCSQPDRLAGGFLVYAFHLEKHPARLYYRHPTLRRALSLTHSGFGRLLSDRLIGKNPDPNLAAALDKTGHRHAGSLDLFAGDPGGLQDLESIFAERYRRAPSRETAPAPALLLAVLNLLRNLVLCHLSTSLSVFNTEDRRSIPLSSKSSYKHGPCNPPTPSHRLIVWARHLASRPSARRGISKP